MRTVARALALPLLAAVMTATPAATAGATSTGAAPKLEATPTLVAYGKPVTLSGRATPAAKVLLEAEVFPFTHSYRKLASKRVSAAGTYSFSARPSHATHYRVVVSHDGNIVTSAPISVYVDDRVLKLSCNLCSVGAAPGSHTLTVYYSGKAPPGDVAVRGPVYFYYGVVEGATPPRKIGLVRKAALRRHGHTLSYSIRYRVDFPVAPFEFRVVACFRNAEAKDGVGLPGHHHCGDKTLSRQQYLGYLG
jgi:hypothetical protein